MQLLAEGLAVAQVGERIAIGHVDQFVLVGHLLAGVAQDAAAAGNLPLAVMEQGQAGFEMANAAVAPGEGRGKLVVGTVFQHAGEQCMGAGMSSSARASL